MKTLFKVALKIAKRSNHEQVLKANNTFGWARAEIIGGLTNAIFLLALCVIIILESIEKFIQLWIQIEIFSILSSVDFKLYFVENHNIIMIRLNSQNQ